MDAWSVQPAIKCQSRFVEFPLRVRQTVGIGVSNNEVNIGAFRRKLDGMFGVRGALGFGNTFEKAA